MNSNVKLDKSKATSKTIRSTRRSRGLRRTNSQSDILKERAALKKQQQITPEHTNFHNHQMHLQTNHEIPSGSASNSSKDATTRRGSLTSVSSSPHQDDFLSAFLRPSGDVSTSKLNTDSRISNIIKSDTESPSVSQEASKIPSLSPQYVNDRISGSPGHSKDPNPPNPKGPLPVPISFPATHFIDQTVSYSADSSKGIQLTSSHGSKANSTFLSGTASQYMAPHIQAVTTGQYINEAAFSSQHIHRSQPGNSEISKDGARRQSYLNKSKVTSRRHSKVTQDEDKKQDEGGLTSNSNSSSQSTEKASQNVSPSTGNQNTKLISENSDLHDGPHNGSVNVQKIQQVGTLSSQSVDSPTRKKQFAMNGKDTGSDKDGPGSPERFRDSEASLKVSHQILMQNEAFREMEDFIIKLQADIEYLRARSIQNEFVCMDCKKRNEEKCTLTNSSSTASFTSGRTSTNSSKRKKLKGLVDPNKLNESMALAESSRRFVEVMARHKRQIEHMTKESARWQNDMHLKLSKFSMMCKDLNDDSALKRDELNVANTRLKSVIAERDSLKAKLETCEKNLDLYEKQEKENKVIRDMLNKCENATLNAADKAIKSRDDMILGLSSRLTRALDTLELERKQQRQRRQIFFPPTSSRSTPSARIRINSDSESLPASQTEENYCEELDRAKDEARIAQSNLRATLQEASKREVALIMKCRNLEEKLNASKYLKTPEGNI
eukprot:CAMPEP_0184868614 /NCGR_PEP_ID=MMETSP0580-20130426/31091_1 /TAXON_ID=1118495 /ORGANISM="Dactyliosolen fragilissimus" /LENGTH=721 /DNA_ID=CAMNT_0027369621 /DNA_START=500 /DNA_END=2665 /DNA_ORIENTATION=+